MDRFRHDVRIALRGLRRTPAFTAAVVAILALGIGMASSMAAVTDAVLRRPLPVESPERVVALWPTRLGTEISLLPVDLEQLRRDSRTMRAIAGFVHWGAFPYAVMDVTIRSFSPRLASPATSSTCSARVQFSGVSCGRRMTWRARRR